MTTLARTLVLVSLGLAPLAGCHDEPHAAEGRAGGRLVVYTDQYPLEYIAERIGGDHVEVHFPMTEDGDPAFWNPGDDVVRRYQEADLVLRNGAGYAAWIDKVTLAPSKVVDCSKGFAADLIVIKNAVTHQHGPEGKHSHSGTAFTTWLDPSQAITMAEAVHAAILARRPEARADLDRGLEGLRRDLAGLEARLVAAVQQAPDRPLLASHPVYQYLARRLGLHLESVHWEPGEVPSEEEWSRFEALLGRHPAKGMLWEDTPLPVVAERLRGLGVTPEVYDPCARKPATGDFMTRMQADAAALERLYRP
ncbi:MAG: metal ABC transporter substrate-binding protein [Planctomycetota bacterium]